MRINDFLIAQDTRLTQLVRKHPLGQSRLYDIGSVEAVQNMSPV